ncbi:MAG: (Fe-S)-binding protein [Chloroflexota bacterium]|nr:MAG: (Fe-S)-binding protein [Chloroflexota bacterium]
MPDVLSRTYVMVPGYVLFWGVTVLAMGLFLYRISQLLRYMFLCQTDWSVNGLPKRIGRTALSILGQRCQLRNFSRVDRAGLGHAFIAWGFLVFFLFYTVFIVIGAGFGLSETLDRSSFYFYQLWVMDILAVLVFAGASWGLVRRFVVRPPRLNGEQTLEALFILVSVLVHPVTHLFKEATSIALRQPPFGMGPILPPVSSALSNLFSNSSASSVDTWNVVSFWAHWLTVLVVLVFIAHSRYLHVLASWFNGILRVAPPVGALRFVNLDTDESIGTASVDNLTSKQVLDLYSCTACGKCQERCPAFASGRPLSPRKLIQDTKRHLLAVGPELVKMKGSRASTVSPVSPKLTKKLVGDIVREDEIWSCTTCRACDEVCPVWVDHVDKIIDMRRNLVDEGLASSTASRALESMAAFGNPWEHQESARTYWANKYKVPTIQDKPDADIIYWVGCAGSYEPVAQQVSVAMVDILEAAGISYAILGNQEKCCGAEARRLGEEGLFQKLAQDNIQLLKSYGASRIVTNCPHCYNTFKNEYPQLGGLFEVSHHSEFLVQLLQKGNIRLAGDLKRTIAFHDSCYLGRYNGILDAPRRVLESIPELKLVELASNRERSFCCGGGGGQFWLDIGGTERINYIRFKEVEQVKVETVVTACPFCKLMLDDAAAAHAGSTNPIGVKDIAEMVMESRVRTKDGLATSIARDR